MQPWEQITEPGTIDDLVADATTAGHQVKARVVRDWIAEGLLDSPQRRAKHRGSDKALHTVNQRKLFLLLLDKRQAMPKIPSLAQIPLGVAVLRRRVRAHPAGGEGTGDMVARWGAQPDGQPGRGPRNARPARSPAGVGHGPPTTGTGHDRDRPSLRHSRNPPWTTSSTTAGSNCSPSSAMTSCVPEEAWLREPNPCERWRVTGSQRTSGVSGDSVQRRRLDGV